MSQVHARATPRALERYVNTDHQQIPPRALNPRSPVQWRIFE